MVFSLFELRFSNKSEKLIKKSDSKIKERLKDLFLKLQVNPVPVSYLDLRKIAGEKNIYRIRLSRFRVVYSVYWDEKIIRIIKIERRKESTYKR